MITKTRLAPPVLAMLAASLAAGAVLATGPGSAALAQPGAPVPLQAFVVNAGSDTVTPVNLTTGKADPAISVGKSPGAIAALPDGKTVYVVNRNSATVTPIDVATDTAEAAIKVGNQPDAIAITPNGKTAYVAENAAVNSLYPGVVVPVNTTTGKAGKPIDVGDGAVQLALTPDGKTLLVLDNPFLIGPFLLKAISTATNKVVGSVTLPGNSDSVTIAPGGKVAYVAGAGPSVQINGHAQSTGVITPVTIATMTEGNPITLGHDVFGGSLSPTAVLFSSNGKWAYVVYPGVNGLDRVNLVTRRDTGAKIRLTPYPDSGVMSADGKLVYAYGQGNVNVVNPATGTKTVVSLSNWGSAAAPSPFARDITLSPSGKTVYALVFGKTDGALVPVSVPGNTRGHPIGVGVEPIEMVIVP